MSSSNNQSSGYAPAPPGKAHMYGGKSAGFYGQCPPLPPRLPPPTTTTTTTTTRPTPTESASADKKVVSEFVVSRDWVASGEKTVKQQRKELVKRTIGWVDVNDPFWEGQLRMDVHVSKSGSSQLSSSLMKQDKEALVNTVKAFGEDALKSQLAVLEREREAKETAQLKTQQAAEDLERAVQEFENDIANRANGLEVVSAAKPVMEEVSIFGMKTTVMEKN